MVFIGEIGLRRRGGEGGEPLLPAAADREDHPPRQAEKEEDGQHYQGESPGSILPDSGKGGKKVDVGSLPHPQAVQGGNQGENRDQGDEEEEGLEADPGESQSPGRDKIKRDVDEFDEQGGDGGPDQLRREVLMRVEEAVDLNYVAAQHLALEWLKDNQEFNGQLSPGEKENDEKHSRHHQGYHVDRSFIRQEAIADN